MPDPSTVMPCGRRNLFRRGHNACNSTSINSRGDYIVTHIIHSTFAQFSNSEKIENAVFCTVRARKRRHKKMFGVCVDGRHTRVGLRHTKIAFFARFRVSKQQSRVSASRHKHIFLANRSPGMDPALSCTTVPIVSYIFHYLFFLLCMRGSNNFIVFCRSSNNFFRPSKINKENALTTKY
jgi:hypothetical protein